MNESFTDIGQPLSYEEFTYTSTSDPASATSHLLRAGEVLENIRFYRPNLLCKEPRNDFRPFVLTPEIIAQ